MFFPSRIDQDVHRNTARFFSLLNRMLSIGTYIFKLQKSTAQLQLANLIIFFPEKICLSFILQKKETIQDH